MKKITGQIKAGFKRTGFYVPFTWYFVLFGGGVTLAYFLLKRENLTEENSYSAIFKLLLKVGASFVTIIISIAFITVLVSYLFFFFMKKKGKVQCELKHDNDKNQHKNVLHFLLNPIVKPVMGFVKIRLQYDKAKYSKKFSTVEKNDQLFTSKIDGTYNWKLPEIKEYNVSKAVIYFEDMFQFFSLALPVKVNNRFINTPREQSLEEMNTNPRKTEDTTVRIDEIKRIEGEMLNYKSFETNDDVRRIVWKIYAKNKELVVRTPEVMDPYASHLYLYASFHSAFATGGSKITDIAFLNYYKQIVWNTYGQLAKKGFAIKYIPDQNISLEQTADAALNIKHTISASRWQKDKELRAFVQTKNASAVIISSLNDVQEVSSLMEEYGNEITVVFVQLSHSLQGRFLGSLLQWIFLQNEKEDIEKWKAAWNFNPLKGRLEKNETAIKKVLERYTKPVMI